MATRRTKKRARAKKPKKLAKRVAVTKKRPAQKKRAAPKRPAQKKPAKKAPKRPAKKAPKRPAKRPAARKPSAEEQRREAHKARERARRARKKREQENQRLVEEERARLAREKQKRKRSKYAEKHPPKPKPEKKPAKPKKPAKKPARKKPLSEEQKKHAKRERDRLKVKKLLKQTKVREEMLDVLSYMREVLEGVKRELSYESISSAYRTSHATYGVDSELRAEYPTGTENYDDALSVLLKVEEAYEVVTRNVQWISVGFVLDARANEEGIRKSIQNYTKYQNGVKQLSDYAPDNSRVNSFVAAQETLKHIHKYHGTPKAILVRTSWTPDGKLWTQNDSAIRRSMKKK